MREAAKIIHMTVDQGFFLLLLNFKIEIPWLDEQPT